MTDRNGWHKEWLQVYSNHYLNSVFQSANGVRTLLLTYRKALKHALQLKFGRCLGLFGGVFMGGFSIEEARSNTKKHFVCGKKLQTCIKAVGETIKDFKR